LLLAATMQGFTSAAGWLGKSEWSQNLGLGLRAGFAGLVLLPNFASYAMDVWAMRAPDFYARWQGGTDRSLVAAAQWLRDHDLKDGELVVTRRYSTVYSDRYTNGWMRAAHVLTDRAVMTMPDSLSRNPDSAVIQWMKQNNARYYLYLPRVYVFGHFRRLSWNGVPLYPQDTDWRLYERTGEQIRQISFESIEPAVRNVPGL
jgi:hypothetical protein